MHGEIPTSAFYLNRRAEGKDIVPHSYENKRNIG
nr:MAG TPA_asm: hypothetical protein [Caudoviricetes sp.]